MDNEEILTNGYKERMAEEYRELKGRLDRLGDLLIRSEKGKLDFELNCDIELLYEQHAIMSSYALILQERARIEGVNLDG